jgi:phosphate transport system substrate-binding protein
MRNISPFFLGLAFLAASCSQQQPADKENDAANPPAAATSKQQITLKGSDTELPLSQKEAEQYMKEHPDASISVVGGGSGVGISALLDATTDIAMASRDLKTEEKLKLEEKKVDIKQPIIAYDALSVVVNPKNTVNKITREQLEDIFTGKITNWKQVGGSDLKMSVYSRESSSGTYEFFKEHVMHKKNYATSVLGVPATGQIIQSVSQTAGGIGYVGMAYVNKEVKALEVSYDMGKTYIAPSVKSAKDKTYPISRPLYYIYPSSVEAKVKGFVDFILSDEGQKLVLDEGFVPMK